VAGKIITGLAESNGSLLPDLRNVLLHCGVIGRYCVFSFNKRLD